MKRVTGHREPWGDFVDVKINAPDLLREEVRKKRRRGRVWVSGVCDPYQPLEEKYRLTRKCLEILAENGWPAVIQTRSPRVLRDMDILREARDFEVGFSIPTADDGIRKLFEPKAPPIDDRVRALEELHGAGVRTYAMIAPTLPGAERLEELLKGKIDYLLKDRMNYHYATGDIPEIRFSPLRNARLSPKNRPRRGRCPCAVGYSGSMSEIVIVGGGFGGLNAARRWRGSRPRSPSWTGAIITSSSRCCTRWRRPSCRRPTSRLPSEASSAGMKTSACGWPGSHAWS